VAILETHSKKRKRLKDNLLLTKERLATLKIVAKKA
jgi:hypothetical protein